MSKLLTLLLTGAVSGGIYAILASGLVVTYTTARVFNFALGATAFTVAFVFYQLNTGLGIDVLWAALLAILVFAPLLGFAFERLIFYRLSRAPEFARIVGTIGILVALPSLTVWITKILREDLGAGLASEEQVFLPPGLGPVPPKSVKIADGVVLNSDQIAVFFAAVAVSIVLWVILRRTRLGLQLRATVDRRDLARLRGIDTARSSAIGTIMGTMLAGLAGVLIAPLFNLEPTVFTSLLLVAAAGAVVGGFKSIPLAMLGGILLGVVQSMVAGYVNIGTDLVPGLRASVPFVLLLVGLLVMGRNRARVAGVVADDAPPANYLSDLPAWRRGLPWLIGTVVFSVWLLGADDFDSSLALKGLALAIVFLSFVVLTGIGGMVSLTQAAFVMGGAFVTSILIGEGIPFLPAALIGGSVAVAGGLIVAMPSLRLGGLPLALATLAMGLLADQMIFQIEEVNGGSLGRELPRPEFFGIDFTDDKTYAFLLLLVFGIGAVAVRNLMRSSTGRSMLALRSSEAGAATSGASPIRLKFLLFGISAAIAGFGGAFLGSVNPRVSPTDFTTQLGLVWVAVVVTFGVRRPGGALLAGLAFAFTPEIVGNFTDSGLVPPILFGLGAIQLASNPDGVLSIVGIQRQRRRARALERRSRTLAEEEDRDITFEGVPARFAVPGSDTPPALELRGISAGYEGLDVVHGIDLVVPAGSIVALMGANGAGKSTLCGVAAGLVEPSAGSVLLNGVDVTSLRAHRRARAGLMLAPEYRGIFPGLTVEENVAVWISNLSERRDALERFPILTDRRKLSAVMLSGGEQQMLTLAPALAKPPQVLIADEPSLGLAPLVVTEILDALRTLRDEGSTILLVEEKAAEALRLADYVVVIDRGRIRWAGPSADIDAEGVQDLYLGVGGEGE